MSRYIDRRHLHLIDPPAATRFRVAPLDSSPTTISDARSREIAADQTVRRILTVTGLLSDVLTASHRLGYVTGMDVSIDPYPPEDTHPMHHTVIRLPLYTAPDREHLITSSQVHALAQHIGAGPYVYAIKTGLDADTYIYTYLISHPDGTVAVIARGEAPDA
jgi:hypothetical protein